MAKQPMKRTPAVVADPVQEPKPEPNKERVRP